MSKSKRLKEMLDSDKLEFIMEAHSGLSAVIAEEAGFDGLWASGLSVSAMTGCKDRNELDLSEVCKVVEWMADHTSVPILVDGDTGGADVNSARIMVNKLTKAGAAGVCIEDKLYPKHNSFLDNGSSDLADPHLHASKIRAMKLENPEFVVIARLEEFISGDGLAEAYNRALIYQEAGADAILVHSKIKTCDEIDSFMGQWNADKTAGLNRIPIVIVPTKYYTTSTDHFRDIGISLVIWANHNLRASINAMKEVSKKIHDEESLISVEDSIATVSEVFRLQRDYELADLEKKVLESSKSVGVILSGKSYNDVPYCYNKIKDKEIIEYQKEALDKSGVIVKSIVTGVNGTELDSMRHSDVLKNYKSDGPIIVSYGDLIYKSYAIRKLETCRGDISVALSKNLTPYRYNEIVSGEKVSEDEVKILFTNTSTMSDSLGSIVGLIRINNAKGFEAFQSVFSDNLKGKRLADLMNVVVKKCDVRGVFISDDDWIDCFCDGELNKEVVNKLW